MTNEVETNLDFFQTKPKTERPMSIEDQVKIYLGDQVKNEKEPKSLVVSNGLN